MKRRYCVRSSVGYFVEWEKEDQPVMIGNADIIDDFSLEKALDISNKLEMLGFRNEVVLHKSNMRII